MVTYYNDDATALRYEMLKEYDVCQAVIDRQVEIWEDMGFLYGVEDEEKKEQMAVAFSNVTRLFVDCDEDFYDIVDAYDENWFDDTIYEHCLETLVYPMIRRIITNVDNFNFDDFLYYLDRMSFLKFNLSEYDDIDAEAEYCALICNAIETSFKRDNEENEEEA